MSKNLIFCVLLVRDSTVPMNLKSVVLGNTLVQEGNIKRVLYQYFILKNDIVSNIALPKAL